MVGNCVQHFSNCSHLKYCVTQPKSFDEIDEKQMDHHCIHSHPKSLIPEILSITVQMNKNYMFIEEVSLF
jgi:hypothetical protein